MEAEHAEAVVEVMGQSVSQLVTREHFDASLSQSGTQVHARIDTFQAEWNVRMDAIRTELNARIDGLKSKVESLEATVRKEIMRAVLMVVGILIPAIGLMLAIVNSYTARGGA